jgi:hypothetical protein
MKKNLLCLGLLLLITSSFVVEGQNKYYRRPEPKFGYGIKAGVNFSGQSTNVSGADYDIRKILRYNGGVYCNYFFYKFLAIQPELMLSGKGVHWADFYDDMKDILTYIDIPLMIKYQPIKYINIQAGPQFGFRIKAMQKDMGTGVKKQINDYYNFLDYGLACGVEANLPNHINLTVRYVFSLSSSTTDVLYIDPWFNNFLQFSLGYRIKGR